MPTADVPSPTRVGAGAPHPRRTPRARPGPSATTPVGTGSGPRWLLRLPPHTQLVLTEATLFVAVTAVLAALATVTPAVFATVELALAVALATFSVSSLAVAVAALRTPGPPGPAGTPRPPVTVIIPAYLPQEADTLPEVIAAHLERGPADLQLVVAYNTPTPHPAEAVLEAAAAIEPRLTVVRVPGSRSKAENVNAALRVASGGIIAIFDADHIPEPGAADRAWRWLAAGADCVQGRCRVRLRPGPLWRRLLQRIVAAEFETMYAVGHPGRTVLHGFGIFGGSNGWWRAEVLRRLRLDPRILTEDIDVTVRALAAGARIVTDPGLVSWELAPPGWRALVGQRLRWAQGWFQVSVRSAPGALTRLEGRERLGAWWLFRAGLVMPWLATLTLPFTVVKLIAAPPSPFRGTVGLLVTLGVVAFVAHTGVALLRCPRGTRGPAAFVCYALASLVFYGHLRVAVVRLGHLHELAGLWEWRPTPRT